MILRLKFLNGLIPKFDFINIKVTFTGIYNFFVITWQLLALTAILLELPMLLKNNGKKLLIKIKSNKLSRNYINICLFNYLHHQDKKMTEKIEL